MGAEAAGDGVGWSSPTGIAGMERVVASVALQATRIVASVARTVEPRSGATVTLLDTTSGVSVTRVTGPDGMYRFPVLEPGHVYTLEAHKDGVLLDRYRGLTVQAAHPSTVALLRKLMGR